MSNSPAARRFFSGATLERAVLEAAGHYGVDPKDLAYTRQGGGLASRGKVVIKVDPAAPTQPAEEAPAPVAAPDEPPATPIEAVEVEALESQAEAPVEPQPEAAEDSAAVETHDDASQSDGEVPVAVISEEPEVEEPEAEEADEANEAAEADDADAGADAEADGGEGQDGEAADEAPAEEPAPGATGELQDLPRSVAEARRSWSSPDEKTATSARKWAESLLRLASLDLDVEVHERAGEISIHLGGADAEVAVDDGGEVLRAIQHLLPRLMLSDLGHTVRCRVDCNDFREIHEEELRTKALQAAQEVLSGAREVTLEPMHPADRRVVHLALAESDLVRTESLGRGFFKRVSIRSN